MVLRDKGVRAPDAEGQWVPAVVPHFQAKWQCSCCRVGEAEG